MGSREAASSFERLGIDAKALSAMPVEAQLGTIMDRMKSVSSSADRVRIATDTLGRSGAELVPVLIKGSEALEKADAKARKTGMSFSAIDAQTIVTANKAFKDSWALRRGVQDAARHRRCPVRRRDR